MRFWVCKHDHKHGQDVSILWQNEAPEEEQVVALFPEFEAALDYESINYDGPFESPPDDSHTVDEKSGLTVETEVLQALMAGAPPLTKVGDIVLGNLHWVGDEDDTCRTHFEAGPYIVEVSARVIGKDGEDIDDPGWGKDVPVPDIGNEKRKSFSQVVQLVIDSIAAAYKDVEEGPVGGLKSEAAWKEAASYVAEFTCRELFKRGLISRDEGRKIFEVTGGVMSDPDGWVVPKGDSSD